MRQLLFLLVASLILSPLEVRAQDQGDNYIPPPLFSEPRPVPPKNKASKVPKMPALSKPSLDVMPAQTPANIVPPKKPARPKENLIAKPVGPAPKKNKIKKNQVEKLKLDSEGVVKGPKTMPSNKKESVDSQILFEQGEKTSINIMERVQTKTEEPIETGYKTLPPTIDPNFTLPELSAAPDGRRKLNLIFEEKQEDLNPEQAYIIDELIIPTLKAKNTTRLQLESYASTQANSLNGDRRIALSRVMATRKHILSQNIEPSRLDVRSLGAETDVQPMDRIEIFIID